MTNPTKRRSTGKSTTPADFPLWQHPSGRWCKKVNGKAHYFGKVEDDPTGEAALKRWGDFQAGRPAKPKPARKRKSSVPPKPYEGFPLFAHASGRWAKKIKGRCHYFGRWGKSVGGKLVPVEDVDASARKALEEFNRQWPFISEGRIAPPIGADTDACTLRTLCNSFWRSKRSKLLAGELSPRSFRDYEQTTDLLIAHFGKDRRVDDLRPDDFQSLRSELAERLGVHALKNTINRVRVVLKFAFDNRFISSPVAYGQSFDRPSAKAVRKARNEAGPRMFEAAELRTILDALTTGTEVATDELDEETGKPKSVKVEPDPVMKAMVLLGVNAGFGNTDVASLPQTALDLKDGWITFPRPKTEIPRRIPLWPETAAALQDALSVRPKPADPADAGLVFLTRNGTRWVRVQPQQKDDSKIVSLDALSQRFGKLLKTLHINGRRNLNFYTLRHVFQTVGGDAKDPDAVSSIMGHADSSMAGQYRERIGDERLRGVVDVVRAWLWPLDDGGDGGRGEERDVRGVADEAHDGGEGTILSFSAVAG